MLQRSPSYILSMPDEDAIANALRPRLGERRAYAIVRWKNVALATLLFQLSQRFPRPMRKLYRAGALRQLPAGYAVDTHFNPRYKPWDQRLCLVPNGDLFETISDGSAEIVTAEIERFTERGIRLRDGSELEADVIITATGLNLLLFGGIELALDGEAVDLPRTMAYKSMMLSGLPNLLYTIGYTNASWTLKADLVAEYACRLINHMDANGHRRAVPVRDPSVGERPFMDFSPGYVLRSIDQLPRQGSEAPWRLSMSYILDVAKIRHGRVDDGVLSSHVTHLPVGRDLQVVEREARDLAERRAGDQAAVDLALRLVDHHGDEQLRLLGGREADERGDVLALRVAARDRVGLLRRAGLAGQHVAGDRGAGGGAARAEHALEHPPHRRRGRLVRSRGGPAACAPGARRRTRRCAPAAGCRRWRSPRTRSAICIGVTAMPWPIGRLPIEEPE